MVAAAAETGAVVTVEDHRPEGGLGDAVAAALAQAGVAATLRKLAVENLPGSGTPEELRRQAAIDAVAIALTARELVEQTVASR